MPITAEQLREIDRLLTAGAADVAMVASLRKLGPGMTATRCDASDMADETPYRSYVHCNLYLLDGRDHCVRVTGDPTTATGVIIAAKGEGA
jgi:5-carboxymethyl-2-hydroxymuconate isomerase